jgi:hypothetical protein
MSRTQARALMDLSIETYQPRMYREDLSKGEAATRIQALRDEIESANSF